MAIAGVSTCSVFAKSCTEQAILQAVLHQLATHTHALSFFATHYGSLTDDFAYHPNIRNMHMSTLVDDDKREVSVMKIIRLSTPQNVLTCCSWSSCTNSSKASLRRPLVPMSLILLESQSKSLNGRTSCLRTSRGNSKRRSRARRRTRVQASFLSLPKPTSHICATLLLARGSCQATRFDRSRSSKVFVALS